MGEGSNALYAARLIALTLAYAITGKAGLALDPVGGFASLVWPPTGIALYALVRGGPGLWPGVTIGALIVNLSSGATLPVAALIAAGNTLEALLGATLLRRVFRSDGSTARVSDAFALLAAALLSPLLGASVGTLTLVVGGVVQRAFTGQLWLAWWLGDVLGDLVIGSVLFNWRLRDPTPLTRRRMGELLALGVGAVCSAAVSFSGTPAAPLRRPHMVFPVLVWGAIRFGPRIASLSVLFISAFGIGFSVHGIDPFGTLRLADKLIMLQGFVGTAALTSLFLAAVNAERTAAQTKLAEEHARLAAVADATQDSIFVKDLKGRYVLVNRAYARLLGQSPDAIIGKRDEEFFPADVARGLRASDRSAARSDEGSMYEETLLVNGERRVFLSAKAPYRVDGQLAGSVGIACDITERKQDEQRLRDAVHARDEFLSIASHELRTPIAALSLQVTGLQRALSADGPVAPGRDNPMQRVDRTVRQLGRLTRLVEDLLDVSRISAGRLQLRLETFDLAVLVHEVVGGLREQGAHAGCTLHVSAESVEGSWDRSRMEQVVTNLLTNAIKYGAKKPIYVTVEGTATTARIEVRDEGIGIAPEDRERIFERFERVATEDQRMSLGVGLFIAREVVQAHGGAIRVDSAPGQGSTFSVEVPRSPAKDRARPAGSEPLEVVVGPVATSGASVGS